MKNLMVEVQTIRRNMNKYAKVKTSYNCSALPSSSLTVTDIYKIKENSDIPKELDYAFAHFAKLKMVKNKSHSFELPSGGPRVKNI